MDPLTMSALIGGGMQLFGNILGGIGQGKQQEKDRQQRIQELLAQLGFQQEQAEMNRADQMARLGMEATMATPDRVNWRQNQAIRGAIMPQLRNFAVQAPAGLEGFMPTMTGGLRIPERGFSPETLKHFSEQAMLAGEEDLDRSALQATGGRSTPASYGAIYGPRGAEAESRTKTLQRQLQAEDANTITRRRQALTNSLQPQGRR